MAGRHRARFRSIQIIRTGVVAAKDAKRAHTMQYHVRRPLSPPFLPCLQYDGSCADVLFVSLGWQNSTIKFPLPHRIVRPASKGVRGIYKAVRPNTYFK
jgi:large subunit ribosomal protein L18Ae